MIVTIASIKCFHLCCFCRTPAVASEPFAGFPMSGADSFHTVDSDTVGDAPSEVALLVEGIMEPETAPVSSGKMEVAAAVAAAFVSEPKQLPPLEDEPTDHPVVQGVPPGRLEGSYCFVAGLKVCCSCCSAICGLFPDFTPIVSQLSATSSVQL